MAPPQDDTALLMTVEEAAEHLRISKASVYKLISDGVLQTVDVGTGRRARTRITRAQLETFIAKRASNRPRRQR